MTDANLCESEAVSVEVGISDGLNQPVIQHSGTACAGGEVFLSIPDYAGSSVFYQWTKDGLPLINNSNELQLNPVSGQDAGAYQVSVLAYS